MNQPPDKFTQIDQAAQSGAFGFGKKPPTDKQAEAGNYQKGHINLYGLQIAIEQPQNSYRTGLDKGGKRWSCRLAANYGYIKRTKGNDKDHVDCFIGSYPQAEYVYIINQFVNGAFDEHKVMIGYPTENFARSDYQHSYSHGWLGLHSMVTSTVKQFKTWLKFGDMSQPISVHNLPKTEISQMQKTYWNDDATPIGTSIARLIYDLGGMDKDDGLLLDSISDDDAYYDFGEPIEAGILDSLNMPWGVLPNRVKRIGRALDKAGTALKVAVPVEGEDPNPYISAKPFNQGGNSMVLVKYRLTDEQTISILFFNPDLTPSKVTKSDIMVAFKWMLNKKDITGLVSPEFGQDVEPEKVAKRIMAMAEGNMKAFARANGNKAEQVKQINDLTTEIAGLETELAQVQAEAQTLIDAKSEAEVEAAMNPAVTPVSGDYTHTFNDDGVTVRVKRDEDGTGWDGEDGSSYDGSIDDEVVAIGGDVPVAVVAPEPVTPNKKDLSSILQDMVDAVVSSGSELVGRMDYAAVSFKYRGYDQLCLVSMDEETGKFRVMHLSDDDKRYFGEYFDTPDEAIEDFRGGQLLALNAPHLNQSGEEIKKAIIDGHRDTDLMLLVGDYFGIDSELDETDVYAGLTKNKNITPEKLRQAYELVAFTEGSESIPIPFEFYSKFEEIESDLAEPETSLDIDQVSDKTRTAWIIEKIIKQHDGVVSWGDFNGAVSGSIFDSVLNGVVGQFGTKTGGVVGYVEIQDNGEAVISINSKGSAMRPPTNSLTNEIQKLKKQIDDAYEMFAETEIVEGDFPDWKTKPAVTVTPVEPAKPLNEIQQQELKLSRLQAMQDRMKAVNKIIKSKTLSDDQKRAKLTDAGFGTEVSLVGKTDFAGRTGYADYELTNNNATIKNTKNRIDELKKRELSASMAASGDRETSYDFDGGTVDLDYDDDRLRVNFASKPNSDMIAKLKSNGFKWSPNAGAWQRQLTDNAIWSTNYLLGTEIKSSNDLIRDLQNKGANVPEPTSIPEPQPPTVETPANSFDADIEALRGLVGSDEFKPAMNDLLDRLEAIGDESHDDVINEIINSHGAALAAKAKEM